MKSKYPVKKICEWFLSKESLTPKKLQKLLYFAYSWDLVFENESADSLETELFSDCFEAWVHGPVVPSIWKEYRVNGYNEITKLDKQPENIDEDTIDTLEQVWEVYGKYNGNELESITHQELPWKNARKNLSPLDRSNENIDKKVIFNYYFKRIS